MFRRIDFESITVKGILLKLVGFHDYLGLLANHKFTIESREYEHIKTSSMICGITWLKHSTYLDDADCTFKILENIP